MAGNYKRILRVLEKWPIEQSKSGRDLGEFLNFSIKNAYKDGKFADSKYWDRQYLSLERIVNNEHKKKYPRSLTSTATGLTAEQCNLILSNEILEQLEQEDLPFYKKIFRK